MLTRVRFTGVARAASRAAPLAAAVAMLAAAALLPGASPVPVLGPGPAGAAAIGFADPSGDSGFAPDVTTVSVRNLATGPVSFRIGVANRAALLPGDAIVLVFDADRSSLTGDDWGVDHLIVVQGTEATVKTWRGSRFVATGTVRVDFNDSLLGFDVGRPLLGNTVGFTFWIESWRYADDEAPGDVAPDGDNSWHYSLHLPFGLVAVDDPLGLGSTSAIAGTPFNLAFATIRQDTGDGVGTKSGASIACRATLDAAVLRGGACRFFGITSMPSGRSTETAYGEWKLPLTARGKTLRATVTVSLRGRSVSRTLSTVVR